jgi:DNA-binding NarL/FixJ family response regulator
MSFSAAVADPHDLARFGTTRLLERLGGRVMTADGAESDVPTLPDLLDLLSAGELDLLVTDISPPEAGSSEAASSRADGLRLLRRARAEGLLGPGAAAEALVLTTEDSRGAVREAFRLGAAGYALKSDPIEEIEAAAQAVLRGERVLSEALPGYWRDEAVAARSAAGSSTEPARMEEGAGGEGESALSDREREVLRLTAKGLTRKEVGRTLSISPRAVKTCRQTVQEKLCLGDRVEMVRYAARSGLL